MRVLGNILWIILGGLAIAIGWAVVGLILCISIIGIPLGIQAFKMAGLTLTPFGATVQYGGGVGSALANILWVVLVGWWMALGYLGAGMLNCITIIGIPFGMQTLKMASLALWPFGKTVRNGERSGGCLYILMNVLWILLGGIWICLSHLAFGVVLCITIIGIPFGLQHFKLAGLALTPFGKDIVSD